MLRTTTAATVASDGSATTGGSGSDSDSSPVSQGSSDGEPKFDQGKTPDFGGPPGCGDSGGAPDTMFSYIWIANSGQGTVSKINTKSGVEEGRYYVEGGSPSRTSMSGSVSVTDTSPAENVTAPSRTGAGRSEGTSASIRRALSGRGV